MKARVLRATKTRANGGGGGGGTGTTSTRGDGLGHVRRRSITATLAGALASTRACQRIIVHTLGRDGVEFVRTLRHCVELHANSSSTAKHFKSDVFKFLAQWIVCEKEGRFPAGKLYALQKPAMRVTLLVVVALHQSLKLDGKRKTGILTARVCNDDPQTSYTRLNATRAKLKWMKHRLTNVDDTLEKLSLGGGGDSDHRKIPSSACSVTMQKSEKHTLEEDLAEEKPDLVDPLEEILKMEDIMEALASSLTSMRSDTALWSELLTEEPPTPKTLADSMRLFGLSFHALLAPMLGPSDSNRLREMIDFASSEAFLADVLTKEEYAQHREVLYRNLTQKGASFGINAVTPTPNNTRTHTRPKQRTSSASHLSAHASGPTNNNKKKKSTNKTSIGTASGYISPSPSSAGDMSSIERDVLENSRRRRGLFGGAGPSSRKQSNAEDLSEHSSDDSL